MKKFRLLFSFIFAMTIVNYVYADAYKNALKKLNTNSLPWFIDEQLKEYDQPEITELTQPVTYPEIAKLLRAYQENKSQRLDRVLKELDNRLLDRQSIQIQNLAKTKQVDVLLKTEFNLDDLINIAYARNPTIRSASEAWLASLNRYPQAAYLDGILRQYNSFTKTLNLLLGGKQNHRRMIDTEFPFPGVTSLRGDIVQTDVLIAELDYAITLRNVLSDIKKAFHDYVFINKAISISRDNQELLEQMLMVASRKFEAGNASYNDVIKARVELAKLSDELITLIERRETIKTRINTLVDRSPKADLGKPIELNFIYPQEDLELLYSLAKQYRQEIGQARLREKRTQLTVALAEEMNRPEPTLGASYFQDRSALLTGSIQDKPSFNPQPGIPLLPWFGQRESFIAEMRNRQRELSEKVNDAINQTLSEVNTIHFSFDRAIRESELYRTTLIPEARQSLEVAEREYEGARIDFLDYLDSQRTWLNYNLAACRSQRDIATTFAELERTIGVSLTSRTTVRK